MSDDETEADVLRFLVEAERDALATEVEQLREVLRIYAAADPADPDTWNGPGIARAILGAAE